MPKRRGNNDEPVSLFPFMSILACLIGILTLMISVSMAAKDTNKDESASEEDKALAVQNRDLKWKAKSLEAEIKKAQEQLKKQNAASFEVAELKDKRADLEKKLEALSNAGPASAEQINARIAALRVQMADLQKKRPEINKQLQEIKAEITARKNPPKKVESVQLRPGSRLAANLFFVECNADGINLIDENEKKTPVAIGAIPSNPQYASFLQKAKQTRDSMVLFLIRDDGAKSYAWAAGTAETKYELRVGKVPMPNDGKIDLSFFKK